MDEMTIENITFEKLLDSDGYIVHTNVGTSMLPLLRQKRDLFEIRKKGPDRCRKYDVVLYKKGSRYILHRIVKVRPRDYVIVGDNCIWREYGIRDDQILGVMVRVIRDGKTINVTDWPYKVYALLWCDFYHVRAGLLLLRKAAGKIIRKLECFSGKQYNA